MNKKILGVVILIGLIVFSFGFMKKEQEVFSSSGISFSQHRYDDKSYIDWIGNSKSDNFFKVLCTIFVGCQISQRSMNSNIVKPVHIMS